MDDGKLTQVGIFLATILHNHVQPTDLETLL